MDVIQDVEFRVTLIVLTVVCIFLHTSRCLSAAQSNPLIAFAHTFLHRRLTPLRSCLDVGRKCIFHSLCYLCIFVIICISSLSSCFVDRVGAKCLSLITFVYFSFIYCILLVIAFVMWFIYYILRRVIYCGLL
jgi:hypothetical protein